MARARYLAGRQRCTAGDLAGSVIVILLFTWLVRGRLKCALRFAVPGYWKAVAKQLLGRAPYSPPPGFVHCGDLRRVTPIGPNFGFTRGTPVDRYYIEQFLLRYGADIHGRVLEIGGNEYTRQFGDGKVTRSDVLHIEEGNPAATFVGDLTNADHLPSEGFDCVIITQTIQLVYDLHAAIRTLQRILKPGGVLLLTAPGITQVDHSWSANWYWAFTPRIIERLLGEKFLPARILVEGNGNVLAATALLHGLVQSEVTAAELDYRDPSYDVIVTARAVK